MAESEFQEGNYDDRGKTRESSKKDMEEIIEKVENLTVHTSRVIYDYTVMRTNPDLHNGMQRLQGVFLRCKEQMERKGQEVLVESRGEGQKQE